MRGWPTERLAEECRERPEDVAEASSQFWVDGASLTLLGDLPLPETTFALSDS
jgi:hypothetical protein